MRKIFLLLLPLLFVLSSCGDNNDNDDSGGQPPKEVVAAFNAKYPKAESIKWEQNPTGNYECDFMNYGIKTSAVFESSGQWLLTEADFAFEQMPVEVQYGFKQSLYSGWKIDDAEYLERVGFEPYYLIEVEQGAIEITLYFTPKGALVKESAGAIDSNNSLQIPAELKTAVEKTNPGATIVDYDTEPNGDLEVDIFDNGIAKSVYFNSKYVWQYTSWDVTKADLPAPVVATLSGSAYSSYAFDDAEYIELSSGVSYYSIDLKKAGGLDLVVNIKPDGTLKLN